jgi:transposase
VATPSLSITTPPPHSPTPPFLYNDKKMPLRRSHRLKPISRKDLTPFQRGQVIGLRARGAPLREISQNLKIPLSTVFHTVHNTHPEGKDQKRSGRPRKSTEEEDKAMLAVALDEKTITYEEIAKKVAPQVSGYTVRRRLAEKHLHKWRAMEREHLDEETARKRMEWALAHRNWTREMWRKRVMWGDEVTGERGGGKRRKWIFRYPKDKWHKDCIEPTARVGERKVSQMMTGCFYGQKYGLFLPVFPHPNSVGGGVISRSIIQVYDQYDFIGIWEEMKAEMGEEELFLIIDNARTHLPFMRWLRSQSVTLKQIPPYSPDLNPIEHIWCLMKAMLHKYYPELYLMRGPKDEVRKAIEEAVTFCWELLDPKVVDKMAESMVHRIEAIIEADGWYTRY